MMSNEELKNLFGSVNKKLLLSLPYWFVCNFYSFEKALMRNENWVDEWETTDCTNDII